MNNESLQRDEEMKRSALECCVWIEEKHGRDAFNPCGNGYDANDLVDAYMAGIESERKRSAGLIEALKFYADESPTGTYEYLTSKKIIMRLKGKFECISTDLGEHARQALKSYRQNESHTSTLEKTGDSK